jgi:hypothetical protein
LFVIDIRFLTTERKEFEDKWRAKLSTCANTALGCFKFKGKLTYIPRIYVIPFYTYDESPIKLTIGGVGRIGKCRINQVAMTSVDADCPEDKWAIYVLYRLITKATEEMTTANIAHELAHFYLRQGKPANILSKKYMPMLGKSEVEKYYMKEKEVDQAENFFEEPVRSMILEMEKEKSRLGIGRKYTEGAEKVKGSDFLARVLGVSRSQDFLASL